MSSEDTSTNHEASYKEQLDQAAIDHRKAEQPPQTNPIIEKITEYVPAAAKILGSSADKEKQQQPQKDLSGPPERPYHDEGIEDFLREQHKSKDQS